MKISLFFSFCFSVFFLGTSSLGAYTSSNEDIYMLHYGKCQELVFSPHTANMIELGEEKCLSLFQESTKKWILLSEKSNFLKTSNIQEDMIQELKTKYYRGEKVSAIFSGSIIDISHPFIYGVFSQEKIEKMFTPQGNYTLSLSSDTTFAKNKTLSRYCRADSFILNCDTGFYTETQKRIDSLFSDILLRGNTLFEKDDIFLQREQEKIMKLRRLYLSIKEEYQDSEKIVYLLESIDYKLSIYESIIENTLRERNLKKELTQNIKNIKGTYFRRLGEDVFITTEKLYIYFYVGNTLVNTIQNDLSHFSSDEILKLGLSLQERSFLAYHIIEKYRLIYEKNLPKDMRLLEKTVYTGTSSLIISEDAKRYTLNGKASQIQSVGENIYCIILENTNKEIQLLRNSGRNSTQVIFTLDTKIYSDIVSYTIRGSSLELSLKLLSGSIEKKTLSL